MTKPKICVIGAGLSGSELVFQLSKLGLDVTVYEPRLSGAYSDEAHCTDKLGELVCSNSLRSNRLHTAPGLLKEELRLCGSVLISIADDNAIPAGDALAVSRDDFCKDVTKKILALPNVKVIPEEVTDLRPLIDSYDAVCICAGPLASKSLSRSLTSIIGDEYLYFYDAIAPLLSAESINMDICFKASRYGVPGDEQADYINCSMSKAQYYKFIDELLKAKKAPLHEGDEGIFFRGCMPIEAMAEDAPDTLLNGPMRGDGLIDPKTYTTSYAAVQLRQDNVSASIYNMVGFQTRLTYPEQERIFRTIPGLEHVEFLRHGSMHRNTFINAPRLLDQDMNLKAQPKVFVAGQLSGVEGYIESIASAFYVAEGVAKSVLKKTFLELPAITAMGSLKRYLMEADPKTFQPMKINLGLLPALDVDDKKAFLDKGVRRLQTRLALSKRSINCLKNIFDKGQKLN